MRIKQNFFSGERPRVATYISKDYEAQVAENCDLLRGDLRARRANVRVSNLALAGVIQTLYQWKKTGDDEWITSTSVYDFARSPIAGEANDRVYFTGGTEPRVLTTSILSSPFDFTADYYKLGVPAPAAALSGLSGYVGGGTGYRAYIYTYVVKLGTTVAEEGSNSAIISISDYTSGNVVLAGFTAPPTGRSIGKIRIYRTASSSSGVSEFLFVGEFDTAGVNFATYTFTDNVADSALGEAFTCEDWTTPPATLAGLIAPDGGSLAGFVGNRVYITEPYLPHAWPYSYPVDATIVGLGWIGNTIVVLTDENVYLLSGQADAKSTTKLPGRYPCLSKAGIKTYEGGVLFPTDEGIALVTLDGTTLLSYEYFTKEQYQDNYSPTTIRSEFYEGHYFGFHDNGTIAINMRDKTLARFMPTIGAMAAHVSLADNHLYFVAADADGTNALYRFADDTTGSFMTYRYRSKEFILGTFLNFSAARVIRNLGDFTTDESVNYAIFGQSGGAVNGMEVNGGDVNFDGLQIVHAGITFSLYGDGGLLHTQILNDDEAFRLPGDILYRKCFFEITGDIPVDEVVIATSMEEILDAAA